MDAKAEEGEGLIRQKERTLRMNYMLVGREPTAMKDWRGQLSDAEIRLCRRL